MKPDNLERISEGALIILVGTVISKLLGYVYRFIVARSGSEVYGLISTGLAVFGILGAIALFGLDVAVTRYVSYYSEKANHSRISGTIKSALTISTITSIIAGVLLFVFSNKIALSVFHNSDVTVILQVFAFAIPLSVLRNIFLAVTRGFKVMKYDVYSKSLAENISRIVFTVIAIILGTQLLGISVAYVLGILISLVLAFFFSEKLFSLIKSKESIPMKKELLTYSVPLTISTILMLFVLWMDTIMIGFFRTMSEVGIYNAVMPTSQLMHIFTMAVVGLFLPVLSSLYSADSLEEISSLYKTVIKWVAMINIIPLFIFIFFPSQVLSILFGAEYSIGGTSLLILSIGFFIYSFSLIAYQILIIFKKTNWVMWISLITMLINFILNYVLIPKMGIDGAAIATSVSFVILALIMFVCSHRLVQKSPLDPKLLNIFASAVISFIIFMIIKSFIFIENKIIYIAVLTLMFIIIYLILLLVTRSFDREDVRAIRHLQTKLRFNFSFINNILRRFI
ncbi:MAG: flippase [Candidatus Nanoarchaeia archaeon]|nr:flippase [Candidatus Nanoarchaeia archaeon]